MKKSLIVGSAMLAFTATAFAADLPGRAPAIAPAPIFVTHSWTGFYVGLNVGYSHTRADFDSSVVNPNGFAAGSVVFVNAMADGGASKGGFTGGGVLLGVL